MTGIKQIFSNAVLNLEKINGWGLALMAVAVLLTAASGMLARKFSPESPEQSRNTIKIVSLIICAGGALLAILG